jgi:tetratricopeptide (TPR) repeat protein
MKIITSFRFILAGIFFLAIGLRGIAQSEKQETYRSYKSRTSNLRLLLDDANRVKDANPSAALDKVQEVLAISIAAGDIQTEAKCYLLMGEINERLSFWLLAKENYVKANKLFGFGKKVSFGSSDDFVKSVVGLANTNLQLKFFDDAVQYYQQAIKLSRGQLRNHLYLSLSEVYYQQQHYLLASSTLKEISLGKAVDESFETLVQNQQIKIEAQLNRQIQSSNIYSNSLSKVSAGESVTPQVNQSLQQTKEEVANALRERQQYDDEIELRKTAIEYNQKVGNLAEVTKDKVEISKTLEAKNEDIQALRELEEAAQLAEKLTDSEEKANAFLSLAKLYEKSGRVKGALEAYKKYSESVRSLQQQMESKQSKLDSIITKQEDIERLSTNVSLGKQEDSLQEATLHRQQLIIYGLMVIIAIVVAAAYFIYRNSQARQTANQLLALKSLRSQMNPHFIFNALNSVNHFIAQQDELTANKFLSEFSQLMRLVLENSEQDFITLSKEQEMLELYLKLEHYRFRDKFDYEFTVDVNIAAESIELPPMLIQPYIENAVWHGLRYKQSRGKLFVSITSIGNEIEVKIADDGIGRKRSNELKTVNQRKHKSTGLRNISERLAIINKVYQSNYRVFIEDLPESAGTIVKIYLPTFKAQAA